MPAAAHSGAPAVDIVIVNWNGRDLTADCLETLEEIAIEGKTIFMQAGGREFHYIPCLNQRDDWIEALADIALENLQGWLGLRPSEEKLAQSRQRALAIGAGN